MNLAIIIIYVINFLGLLIAANQHGKQKIGVNRFQATFIATIINLLLLWWALGWVFI